MAEKYDDAYAQPVIVFGEAPESTLVDHTILIKTGGLVFDVGYGQRSPKSDDECRSSQGRLRSLFDATKVKLSFPIVLPVASEL